MKYLEKYKQILSTFFKQKKYNSSLSTKVKIDFFDNLSSLVNAGIPLTNAINIMLYQSKNKTIILILEEVLKNINK